MERLKTLPCKESCPFMSKDYPCKYGSTKERNDICLTGVLDFLDELDTTLPERYISTYFPGNDIFEIFQTENTCQIRHRTYKKIGEIKKGTYLPISTNLIHS